MLTCPGKIQFATGLLPELVGGQDNVELKMALASKGWMRKHVCDWWGQKHLFAQYHVHHWKFKTGEGRNISDSKEMVRATTSFCKEEMWCSYMLQTEYDKIPTVWKISVVYHMEQGVTGKLGKPIIKNGLRKLAGSTIVKYKKTYGGIIVTTWECPLLQNKNDG